MSAPSPSRSPSSPAARRVARPSWRDPRLALGLVLVVLCGLLGARLLARADDTVSVWSLGADKVAGQSVISTDVARVRLHFASQDQADRYLSADEPLPEGLVLQRAVSAGELLPRAALGHPAEAELVEVPLAVPDGSLPGTVRVGSTVDVWVTATQDGTSGRARLVLDDVPVVALGSAGSDLAPSAEAQVIVGVGRSARAGLGTAIAAISTGRVVVTREAR